MASPRDRLGTHDRRFSQTANFHEFAKSLLKWRSLHIVRESPEGRVAPTEIGGILLRVAKPTQRVEMRVSDPTFFERSRERRFIELWIMPGFGNGSDIDHFLNPMGLEQVDELADAASGVADGEQRRSNRLDAAGVFVVMVFKMSRFSFRSLEGGISGPGLGHLLSHNL